MVYVRSGHFGNVKKNQYQSSPSIQVCLIQSIFNFIVSFFPAFILGKDERNPFVRERPRDSTGKFYIYRRPSGEEVITGPVREKPDPPKADLPKPRQNSTARFLQGKAFFIAFLSDIELSQVYHILQISPCTWLFHTRLYYKVSALKGHDGPL
jgi:hypothetical protein